MELLLASEIMNYLLMVALPPVYNWSRWSTVKFKTMHVMPSSHTVTIKADSFFTLQVYIYEHSP